MSRGEENSKKRLNYGTREIPVNSKQCRRRETERAVIAASRLTHEIQYQRANAFLQCDGINVALVSNALCGSDDVNASDYRSLFR
jgi:hypothetical protein